MSSPPAIDAVDPRKLHSEIFQSGQRVRFSYSGEYGSEMPGRDVYSVKLLPPFQHSFCLRPEWHRSCPICDGGRAPNENDRPSTVALKYRAYLDTEQLKTAADLALLKCFEPYGLKLGSFMYALTYADSRASYSFTSRIGTR